MSFEDELAREAAQVAAEYVEDRGRAVDKLLVAVATEEGGGAIVGMRGHGADDDELLEHLAKFLTVLAGAQGKHIRVVGL